MAFHKYIAIFFLVFCAIPPNINAQTLKAYEKAAENALAQKNNHAALEYFGILLEVDADNPNYLYKYAEAARGYNAYQLADTMYRRVRLEADTLFPLANYWEANMKQRMGKYGAAQMVYEFYLANHENHDPKYTVLAKENIKNILWAVEAASEPDEDLKIERLNNNINTDYSEFAPSFVRGKLYYSSFAFKNKKDKYKPARQFAKILISEDEEKTEVLTDLEDNNRHIAHFAVNSDTTMIYYTLCDYINETDVTCEIYRCNINADGTYGEAEKLPEFINDPISTNTQPDIGIDNKTGNEILFFTSNRKGGRGGLDIWSSIIGQDNILSAPINVTAINSEEDEITPFFHTPTNRLYFSSESYKNLGGFDVFYAEKDGDKWGTPTNVGSPINTSYNDTHYWLNEGEIIGYLSSNRPGSNYLTEEKEACCYDLYRSLVTAIELNLFAFNKKDDSELIGATVTLYEVLPNGDLKEIGKITNGEGNDFSFKLETGKKYILQTEKDGFITSKDMLDLSDPNNLTSKKIERKVYLEPVLLDFLAHVFDKDTKRPLNGVTLQIFKNGQVQDLVINKDSNDFLEELNRDQQYTFVFSKPGWFPDTLNLNMKELKNPLVTEVDVFLKEMSIEEIVPLVLYFDNDQPNPKTMRTTTDKAYSETARNYFARKQVFIDEYVNVLEGRDKFLAEKRIEAFFEREIKDGNESLLVFCSKLTELLAGGQKIKIYIKGYASPRAGADYNFNLGKRRVHCIRNQFDTYAGGIFQKYINNNSLIIEEISFGSSKAPKRLVDKLSDDRSSIYGILASRERRVEIVGIRIDDGNKVIDTVNPTDK